jgi:hypothetical protein
MRLILYYLILGFTLFLGPISPLKAKDSRSFAVTKSGLLIRAGATFAQNEPAERDVGNAAEKAARDAAKTIEKGAHDAGHAIEKGAHDTGNAIEKGAQDTIDGVVPGPAVGGGTHGPGGGPDD